MNLYHAHSSVHNFSASGTESGYTNDRDEGKFCFNPHFYMRPSILHFPNKFLERLVSILNGTEFL